VKTATLEKKFHSTSVDAAWRKRKSSPRALVAAKQWRLPKLEQYALAVAVAAVLLSACGDDDSGTEPKPAADGGSHMRGEYITVDGIRYTCIVYERMTGYAGAGGLWCERTEAG
jgi:hypothetical protein